MKTDHHLYFIDSHAHLDDPRLFEHIQQYRTYAEEAGVQLILNVSTDIKSVKRSLNLAQQFEEIFISIGIHPHYAEEQTLAMLPDYLSCNKVIAIGETGLDYYRNIASKEKQKQLFHEHIKLAHTMNLPLIIHQRESMKDIQEIIQNNAQSVHGIMHCFSGTIENAYWCLDHNFMISFAGNITYPKSQNLRNVIKALPLEKILIETDCPWLAPHAYRGKTNHPSYIEETYKLIAELKNISLTELCTIIKDNFHGLFPMVRDLG